MSRSKRLVLFALSLSVVPLIVHASDNPAAVGDFGLIDHRGTQWTLSRLGQSKAVVILTQANSCTHNIDLLPKYKLLRTTWEDRGFEFLMMNSSPGDDLDSVRRTAAAYDIDFPILLDESQLVAETLRITDAGEVLVLDPRSRRLLYRGPLTAASGTGGPRGVLKFDDSLEGVMAAAAEGKVDATTATAVGGALENACAVRKPATRVPDYATEVAPVLIENCTRCHVEGGIGPFPMNRYLVVRGWAPMIREVLMTKRMPPMQVDPHYNRFENASYISNDDVQTLVRWVDAGAPRGAGAADPLEDIKPLQTKWQLGEPDYIVDVPAFEVPATGVVNYFNHTIDLPFDEDKWVRAVQFIPGDTRVLHHLLAYVAAPGTPVGELAVSEDNVADFLEGYAPGKMDATTFPAGTGVFIAKGQKLSMQMHYTPIGTSVTDRTRLGLYFYDEPPEHKYQTHSISHWSGGVLQIPPGEANHRMNHNYLVKEDMRLYALRPHMHFRGKAFRFSAVYPDQSTEVLMNVPRYDFKWQPTYRLTEPKLLPAGTRIIIDGVHDNSPYHPGNPDPTVTVLGGLQSWEEMFIGYITYTLPNSSE